ncbi:MAG: nucleotidyl transferase AbiEii/AbiGii toxin family protein [Alphaproteobacteria bacterium]|nr:nucleotidyl transferase AbiEii/AbiGii toxin family protein [Alphaproteobacteria bacterium]
MKKINAATYRTLKQATNPRLAEQDYLECQLLSMLFQDEFISENFVFTGGATLSKSYSFSTRIGQDVDLALVNFTDVPPDRSKKQLSKFRKTFKQYVFGDLKAKIAQIINDDGRFQIITDHDWPSPENVGRVASSPALHLLYQSEFGNGHLCLEITPRRYPVSAISYRGVLPYSCNAPLGVIPTVAYEQTFWDKVFALHSNANATTPHCDKCFSRHYHDVAMLAPHVNLDDTYPMLNDTIRYQTRHTTKEITLAHARDALLVPDDKTLYKLSDDYYAMSGAFTGAQTSWNTIVQTLQNLTQDLRTL